MLLLCGSVGATGYYHNVIDSFVPNVTSQNQKHYFMHMKREFYMVFLRVFQRLIVFASVGILKFTKQFHPFPMVGKGYSNNIFYFLSTKIQ